jgi:nicotinamide mononucleotide (NMN) deamidase PncC
VAQTGVDTRTCRHVFSGDRSSVRQQAAARALQLMAEALPD